MSSRSSGTPQRAGPLAPIVLLILGGALLWAAGDRMVQLEYSLFDFIQQRAPAATASDQILLVNTGAAQSSLWADQRLPAAIARLAEAGAAAIVPTQAPSTQRQLTNLDQLAALLDLEKRVNRPDSSGEPRDMDALAEQLARIRAQHKTQKDIQAALASTGKAVLPWAVTESRNLEDRDADPCSRLAVSTSDAAAEWPKTLVQVSGSLALPQYLCESAAAAGHSKYRADLDGAVRQSSLLVKSDARVLSSLAIASVATATANTKIAVGDDGSIALGTRRVKAGGGFNIHNRYYANEPGQQVFDRISIEALLSDDFDAARLKDRIALVGPSDAEPRYKTPANPALPQARLLATNISNLIQADYLVRPNWLKWSERVLLVGLGILFVATIPAMSLNAAAFAALLIGLLLIGTEAYLLLAQGIWARLGSATVFSVLGIAAIYALRYLKHQDVNPAAAKPRAELDAVADADELDLAFSVLRQQAPNEDTKESLYQIALTHGKRREYAKAERVLRYLASIDPEFRGVEDKLKKLSGARKEKAKAKEQAEAKANPDANIPRKRGNKEGTLGRYELEKVIGRGAMATVYLGRDPKINRQVAIKTIALAEEFSDEDLQAAKDQFLREAESAGRLNHPNIITVFDVGEDEDVAYLAMEYCEGKSLSSYAQQKNLLPPEWVLELGARAAEALHYAHSQKVVHRDIKPANILYNAAKDELKLTDFGIARLTDTSRTKTGIILGTPSYMSPEQLSGNAVTGQSDLYSLGITLYHLLTGAPPFRADSIPKLMDKIVNDKHADLSTIRDDVPPGVDAFFDQALAKDPQDRFTNGREMALALRDCCSSFAA